MVVERARPSPAGHARRVVVVGDSASGKTTFARQLAARLGVPHVELDAYHHAPGWTEVADEVMRDRVAAALDDATLGWVADGNYAVVRDIVWGAADTLVWLDLPLPVVFARLTRRTLVRVARREELWGTGNRESLRTAFASRDSLYLWVLRTHWDRRRRYPEVLADPAYRHLRVVRLRSRRAVERWLTAAGRSSTDR
jgi:adenylate kinase family enzyme